MIHVLNDLPKDFNVILDDLENCLTLSSVGALMIEVIREKLNHRCKKIKNKNEEKIEKEKVLGTYKKQFKGK